MSDDEKAERLRELAAQTDDPKERDHLLDAAAEAEGSSLLGVGSHRAKVDDDRRSV